MMVRLLLSVRPKTPINLCLIEAGIEPLRHIIKKKRALYLQQKFRDVDMEQPFHQIHAICREANAPAAAFMANAIRYNRQSEIGEITDQVRTQEGTKFVTYRDALNTELTVHPLYTSNEYLPDFIRASFTRLRLMSHSLKVETGRWSRIPREERRCDRCDAGGVQDEEHVLIACSNAQDIRLRYPYLDFSSMKALMGVEDHRKV